MNEFWRSPRLLASILALCAVCCFLPGIGRVSLFDRDEPRFAEAAREMIVRGDYVVPYFNDEPRLHKPPLIYWVMIGAYKLFGVNEFSARIGSAIAGVIACVLVFVLARSMFGNRVAFLAGIIMATNVMTIIIARAATADSVQLLTLMICFLGFWRVYQGDRRLDSFILLYGGLALGGLVKGPVVVSVFLVAALGIMVQERQMLLFRKLRLIQGMIAAVAIVGLWLIPADLATNGEFIRVGIGHHVLDRAFRESMEGHSGPFFYYLVLLPGAFFPWFLLLPAAIRQLWIEPEARRNRAFLLAWAIAPFILFSFLKTKLPHYTLPAYPALAIITAAGIDAIIRDKRLVCGHWLGKAGMALFVIIALAAIVGLAGFPFYAHLEALKKVSFGAAVLLAAVLGFTLNDFIRRRNHLAVTDLAAGMTLLVMFIGSVYLPTMDKECAARRLALKITTIAAPGDEIYSVGYREPTLAFYARRHVNFSGNWEEITEPLLQKKHFICIATESKMARMPADLRDTLREVGHASAYALTKGTWVSWTFLAPKTPQ